MNNVKEINDLVSKQIINTSLDKITPENVMKKQKEIHSVEGFNPKTLNVAFALEMFPLLVCMLAMSIGFIIDHNIFKVYFESFHNVLFFVYMVVAFIITLYLIGKDFFGFTDKLILRSINKTFKKYGNYPYHFSTLFYEEAKQSEVKKETIEKAKQDGIIDDNDIKYLKIKGNGIVRAIDLLNATVNEDVYNSFKQKVKEYF